MAVPSRYKILSAGLWLGLSLATSPLMIAQTTSPRASLDKSGLDSILARLDENIDEFNRNVPSFFSREEVASDAEPGPNGTPSLRTNTSSTFVVRRAGDPDDPDDPARDSDDPTQANALHESRVVRTIDEKGFVKPAEGARSSDMGTRMDSPYVIFGIFSGGITRISTPGKVCFHYRLHPAHAGHDGGRIVIDFESWPRKDRGANCPYEDHISGRGFIDPETMRLVRLENTSRDDKGTWTWSVDYAPVALGDKMFWLPTTIRSADVATTQTISPVGHNLIETTVAHHLTARYSRYRQAKTSAQAH